MDNSSRVRGFWKVVVNCMIMKNHLSFFTFLFSLFFAQAMYGQCDSIPGFILLGEYDGHGYYLSEASVPWAQAKTLSENAGGYLATIKNQAINDLVKDGLNGNMVFIGYHDEATEGAGQWVNNELVALDLSYGNSEVNDYAVMNFWDGTWQMTNGLGYRKFVMEKVCGEPSHPQVEVVSVLCPDEYPYEGNDITLTIVVKNLGGMTSPPTEIPFSQTASCWGGGMVFTEDEVFGYFNVPGLAPLDSVILTKTFTLTGAKAPGNYVPGCGKWGGGTWMYNDLKVGDMPLDYYCKKYSTDLSISVTGDSYVYDDSGIIQYEVTVTNYGPDTAYNFWVDVNGGPLNYLGSNGGWKNVFSLAPGASISFPGHEKLYSPPNSYVLFRSIFAGHNIDTNPANDSVSVQFYYLQSPCDTILGFAKLGGYNGHSYYLSDASAPWQQAKILAENAGGYLATMNDQAENDFVKSKLGNNMVFIGYHDATTEGAGQWVDNEPVTLDLSYGNSDENDYGVMNFWDGTWQMTNGLGYRKFVMEMSCAPSSCLAGGIVFGLQSEVDSFPINYPGCQTILGDVLVTNQVTNVDGLLQLKHIEGNLQLESVTDISGLQNLKSCNDLTLATNVQNGSLSNLKNLDGDLRIQSLVTSTKGLEHLEVIKGDIISYWNQGTSLSSLENLTTVEGALTLEEATMTTGNLPKLTYLGGINLSTSNLSIEGMHHLTHVGMDGISCNGGAFMDMSGLTGLTEIDGLFNVGHSSGVVGTSSLQNLTKIGGLSLKFVNSNGLGDISFLSNLDSMKSLYLEFADIDDISPLAHVAGLEDVTIKNCFNLSYCSIQPICDLIGGGGNVMISGNGGMAIGCHSIQEVEDICAMPNSCDDVSGFIKLGEYNGHGYYLSDASAPWQQAKTLAENAGGYLVTMNNQTENDFVKSHLNNQMVFVGYNDAATEGVGQWADNEPVTLDLSYGNSDVNDYGVMNFWDGGWQMTNGLGWRKFVMEMDCGSPQPTPMIQNAGVSPTLQIQGVYPNPAKDNITIRVIAPEEKSSIFNVYDGRGQLLLSEKRDLPQGASEEEFDLSNLPVGMYFVKEAGASQYYNFVIMR